MRTVGIRRLALIAVALAAVVGAVGAAAAPADASNGSSVTEVHAFGQPYGTPIGFEAWLRDASTSCDLAFVTLGISGCDPPAGRVDFYAVVGADQTFLAALGLSQITDLGGCSILACSSSETYDPVSDSHFGGYCCLEPGTYTIRGYYVPGDFDPSSDDDGPITVGKGGTSTSVSQSSSTTWFGQPVTFTVHVAGGSDPAAAKPTGSVSVSETTPDGTVTYGTAPVDSSGNATITTTQLSAGTRDLHVHYSGDSRYDGSTSDSLSHVVNGAPTESGLSSSATSATYGEPVTLTANVSVVAPALGKATGSVGFYDGGVGGTLLGTAFLNGGSPNVATLTVSVLSAGSHRIQAHYDGAHDFNSSTTNAVTVDVARAGTTTTVTSSANPSGFGQAVTFTASVDAPGTTTAPGTIQFMDGTAPIGSAQSLIVGVATLTIGTLSGGPHAISAVYSGSSNLNGSTSAPLAQSVTCDRMVTGSVSSVTASATGSTCLSSAKVSGNVTVPAGAKLSILTSTVGGNLRVSGAGATSVCGSTVGGSVSIGGSTGFVLLGNQASSGCVGNVFKGAVTLSSNRSGLALADNTLSGGASVSGNSGASEVAANRISGFLTCSGNSPAVTNGGRANSVTGARSGECAAAGF